MTTIETIYKAFKENPVRLTYSTKKLEQQFNASEQEVKKAKELYRLNPIDFIVAQAMTLHNTIPESDVFEVLVEGWSKQVAKDFPNAKQSVTQLTTDSEWEVKQKWVKGPQGSQLLVKKESTDYKKEFQEFVENYTVKTVYPRYTPSSSKLAVVALFDIHLGKIAHFKYTGSTDNLSTQEQLYKQEFGKLLTFLKGQDVDQIILPIGNDLLNVDNDFLTTTKGTKQSSSDDLHGMFQLALNLMCESINSLAQIAPVRACLVPGNHAKMSETYLAIALHSIYKDNQHVVIDHEPNPRKYYQWGKVLIGLAHGELPLKKYAELLPYEAKEFFSSSNYFEILVGDKHVEEVHKSGIYDEGVVVRRLAALTSIDMWHYQQGYTLSKRRSYVLIYDKENGLEIQYTNSVSS